MSKPRWVIYVDGKWQGGSFATEDEAKAVAAKVCKGKKWTVKPKGGESK